MSSLRGLRTKRATPLWSWLVAAARDPNLIAVVLFCAIGLLATVDLILRFPDLGAMIAQCNQF
jgi:hypothetical protein